MNTEEKTLESKLNDALLITNFFLVEICNQMDIELDTALQIKFKNKDGINLIKEYTLEECLIKNKELIERHDNVEN